MAQEGGSQASRGTCVERQGSHFQEKCSEGWEAGLCRTQYQKEKRKTPEICISISNSLILLLNIKLHMYRVKLHKEGERISREL